MCRQPLTKPITYLGPWNVSTRHGVLPYPHARAGCRRDIFTVALLLATALFSDCLKMSNAQDLSSTLNKQS